MLTMGIMFIAFVACGVFVSTIALEWWEKPKVKSIKSKPVKVLPMAQSKKSIQEVLNESLKNPPTGCMWEVVRNKRTVRANNYNNKMQDVYSANVKFINPYKADLQFTLILHDELSSSNRIKSFEDELTYHVEIVLGQYKRLVLAAETKQDLEDGWDGVYN
jgi:hypothetical protein